MNAETLSQFKKWCNKCERCRADFKARAQKFGLNPEDSDNVLATLEKEGWIDERRYAKAFVHDKSVIAKWPEKRIRLTLKTKAIPEIIVQEAMDQEYVLDEFTEIKRWIDRKIHNYKHNDKRKRYAALFRFLSGKGFPAERISEVLRDYRVDSDDV